MDTIYIEYIFTVEPKQPAVEILIAELGNVGFESFVENESGVKAYIQKQEWNDKILTEIYILNSGEFDIKYELNQVAQINWNEEWEKNFNPIQVDDTVYVRAPFHEKQNLQYDIVIEPKMSFGTGHHETTHMMIQHLLALDLTDKKVLDMGCGTGILAVLSEMKGAKPIDAIDIDYWCYTNTKENIVRNACNHIKVYEGDASLLAGKTYDVIIANINRNILLNDMEAYANCLTTNGVLLLSGFYKEDIALIEGQAVKYQIRSIKTIERNKWVAMCFKKA